MTTFTYAVNIHLPLKYLAFFTFFLLIKIAIGGDAYIKSCLLNAEYTTLGQTHRCMYNRIDNHFDGWIVRKVCSVFLEHTENCHGGDVFKIKVSIVLRCFVAPNSCIISEAVHVDK